MIFVSFTHVNLRSLSFVINSVTLGKNLNLIEIKFYIAELSFLKALSSSLPLF